MNKNIYKDWIDAYDGSVHRRCAEVTLEMSERFPELNRVRGHVIVDLLSPRPQPHWWLVTPEGLIVDPTIRQYFSSSMDPNEAQEAGLLTYLPVDEEREYGGQCPGCGDNPLYDGDSHCSLECAQLASRHYAGHKLLVAAGGIRYTLLDGEIIKSG